MKIIVEVSNDIRWYEVIECELTWARGKEIKLLYNCHINFSLLLGMELVKGIFLIERLIISFYFLKSFLIYLKCTHSMFILKFT
jgi:hypothetical protein